MLSLDRSDAVDWNAIAVRTSRGTILPQATIRAVEAELDKYLYYMRTGVNVMDRVIISFNSLASNAGLGDDWYKNLTTKDRTKIMSAVETELDNFIARKQSGGSSASTPVVDPAFAKAAPAIIHAVFTAFDKTHKGIPMSTLAGMYAMKTEADDVEEVTSNLRAFVKLNPELLSAGSGPNPVVVRLRDGKGKATGAKPFEHKPRTRTENGPRASGLLRRSPKTEEAFADAGLDVDDKWEQWVAYCDHNQVDEPSKADLRNFRDGK